MVSARKPGAQFVRLVMTRATIQLAVGLALGAALRLLASGPLQPLLYRVQPRDPLVLATVPIALAAASLAQVEDLGDHGPPRGTGL